MQPQFDLLLPKAFVRDAAKKCATAGQRIFLLSMVILEGQQTEELINALCDAAKRGVTVLVCADSFTFSEGGAAFNPRGQSAKNIKLMIKKFKDSGVNFNWLGLQATSLVNGRTHSKWLVVDDTIYSFGGVNLYDRSLGFNDYMLRVTDRNLADRICFEQDRIIAANKSSHNYRSHRFGDDTTQVLIDGGFVGDSIIYRHALKLAEQAHSILFVSQYSPGGKLARILKKKRSLMYFNRWQQATFVNKIRIRMSSFINQTRTLYTKNKYLHAKFMIFTMPDGGKIALTGSHNFATGGVIFGTREIALETRDKHIIAQLEAFFDKSVA